MESSPIFFSSSFFARFEFVSFDVPSLGRFVPDLVAGGGDFSFLVSDSESVSAEEEGGLGWSSSSSSSDDEESLTSSSSPAEESASSSSSLEEAAGGFSKGLRFFVIVNIESAKEKRFLEFVRETGRLRAKGHN